MLRFLLNLIFGMAGRPNGPLGSGDSAELDPTAAPPARATMQTLITSDGDQRIVVKDITVSPWRPFCCLKLRYSDGSHAVGSGILIAPDMVLTAAHNLYALDLGTFVTSAVAEIGMKDDVAAASARVKHVEICPGYTRLNVQHPDRFKFDYGVARLDSNALYKWAGEYAPIADQEAIPDADLSRSLLNVAGYPDNEGALRLKTDSGPIVAGTLSSSNFRYKMDTMPGQSGCPVFRYHADSKTFLYAGVHVAGEKDANLARRYDIAMRAQVKSWLSA